MTDQQFYPWFNQNPTCDLSHLDTNWPEGSLLSQGKSIPRFSVKLCARLCTVVQCDTCFPALIVMLPLWTMAKKAVIWNLGKSLWCASLRMLVVNFHKRVINLLEGPANLMKMCIGLISFEFLICDARKQLFWWNIAVANFTPKQICCWQLRSFVTACWWLMSTFQSAVFQLWSCWGQNEVCVQCKCY